MVAKIHKIFLVRIKILIFSKIPSPPTLQGRSPK